MPRTPESTDRKGDLLVKQGALVLLAAMLSLATTSASGVLETNRQSLEVRLPAVAHPDRFQGFIPRWFGMPGYHLLVWEEGRSARNALFTTSVPDSTFVDAMRALGADGVALPEATWAARKDRSNSAPDGYAEGTVIRISFLWPAFDAPVDMSDLIENPAGDPLDFRFTGSRAGGPDRDSGCGVCLYSCPGGAVSNAAYSVRDYVDGVTQFQITDRFPPDGTAGTLILRLVADDDPRNTP